MRATRLLCAGSVVSLALSCEPLPAQTYRAHTAEPDLAERPHLILQTNAAGDNIHVVDPGTNRVIGIIDGIPRSHGVTLHPEGTFYYVTNEQDHTVDVVDSRTYAIVRRLELAAAPNNIAASDRARKVYVAINGAPLVQVIDMSRNEIVRDIPTPGGVHNTFVTPDGRFVVAGMIGARTMSVIDVQTDEIVWQLEFDNGVRPIAFETWPDGSTRRAFVQISGWHGFYVVDWNRRELVERISLPVAALSELEVDGTQNAPSHGSVVLPDQSMLWISSRATAAVYAYELPGLRYLGRVHVGSPDWITAGSDGRLIYVGVASENQTAVVDTREMKVVARIPVGQVPKRIYTAVFPRGWSPPEGGPDGR